MNKNWINYGVTIALIIAAVISINFVWVGTPIIALITYAIGRSVGYYVTEPEVITKVVEKIVEVPAKKSKNKQPKKS